MMCTHPSRARRAGVFTALTAAAVTLGAAVVPVAASAAPTASAVYDALPTPLPPNVASLGFQATSTAQIGDSVHLAGTDRVLQSVTVTLSNWALYSTYANDARYSSNTSSFTHPITVKVFSTHLDTAGVPDTLLASVTQNVTIPWRPEADPTCPGGTAWRASNGNCYNGLAVNVDFDLSSAGAVLPDDVIVAVAYSTQSYGSAPLGVNGPYNSLNVGIASGQTASVGADADSDALFWDTTYPGYTAGLKSDSLWTPNGTLNVKITAGPPVVGPPTSTNQCKDGGWKSFNNPTFRNQGQCVSYVATRK